VGSLKKVLECSVASCLGALFSRSEHLSDLETQALERSIISMESIKSFEPSSFLENIVMTSPTVIDHDDHDNGVGCECGIDVSFTSRFSPLFQYPARLRLRMTPSFVKGVVRSGSTFGWYSLRVSFLSQKAEFCTGVWGKHDTIHLSTSILITAAFGGISL
jgi:hypothetical protein